MEVQNIADPLSVPYYMGCHFSLISKSKKSVKIDLPIVGHNHGQVFPGQFESNHGRKNLLTRREFPGHSFILIAIDHVTT